MNYRGWKERFPVEQKAYGGKPFWAWNCRVESVLATRQIEYFDKMGMGGFVIHSRTGLGLSYLGREFMERVRECIAEARNRGMKVWIYDEDRWPSGFAGGLVTKYPEHRAHYLVFTPWEGGKEPLDSRHKKDGRLDLLPHGGGIQKGMYAVSLRNGKLEAYRKGQAEQEWEETWYLYDEEMEKNAWFNNQTYMDTLNSKTVKKFVDITYEAYRRELGEAFGNEVTAIFTDEPQFVHKRFLEYEGSREPVVLPWTNGMGEKFEEQFGFSLLDRLPELIWDTEDGRSFEVRYCFHRFLGELFAETYCDFLGTWCKSHGIMLTGHMKGEDTLQLQAASLGEAMRNYYGFQIPGVDILCDKRLYTTVKQAQSASRQMGKKRVTSEEYGVTNWDFDFAGHKLQGDWQAALGVTDRVPHLAWMSMEGEAKRDFPASIFYQSPWYGEYATLEQYFSRIRMAMETGEPVVRVGVIHPIESYWMLYGGTDHDKEREHLEIHFKELTEWLLFNLVDFDFISEALLEKLPEGESGLQFGKMCYQTILIPELLTLRESTLKKLWQFKRDGGEIVFVGSPPEYLEAKKSEAVRRLAEYSVCMESNWKRLLERLEMLRDVEILGEDGRRSEDFLYQLRTAEKERWLFLANGRKQSQKEKYMSHKWNIMVKGNYEVEIWDAMDGTVNAVKSRKKLRGEHIWTVISKSMTNHDSLLLRLSEDGIVQEISEKQDRVKNTDNEIWRFVRCLNVDRYTCEEPNVLMLDQAWFRLDEGVWEGREELLRVENNIRTRLGYPLKLEAYAQPWTLTEDSYEEAIHNVTLRFEIIAETSVEGTILAVEQPDEKDFFWDGMSVLAEDMGFYVDECIRKIRLPAIKRGKHELMVRQKFYSRSNLEWMYLLGDFGVDVKEQYSCLVKRNECIGYGSLTSYGMPFYGGTVHYLSQIETEEGEYLLEVSQFQAPVISVTVDKKRVGIIAFAPYRILLKLSEGVHEIDLAAFGSRINTFGPVHNCDGGNTWFGPGAWRTEGKAYSYAYQLKNTGILEAPKLYRKYS